ncbi:MAG TPA: hypothetical protein VHG08_01860 [Longimicrobium sp.]|nr:hypothetical protein [Longimicrobium sp.]
MPRLTLTVDALKVESFPTATAEPLSLRPTTGMNTNEPGCTMPELCTGTI